MAIPPGTGGSPIPARPGSVMESLHANPPFGCRLALRKPLKESVSQTLLPSGSHATPWNPLPPRKGIKWPPSSGSAKL